MQLRPENPSSLATATAVAPGDVLIDQRAQLFFRSSFVGILTGAAVGILYATILRNHFDHALVNRWLLLLLGVCATRVALFAAYWRLKPAPGSVPHWFHAGVALAALNGVVWGLGGIWFLPNSNAQTLFFIHAFIIAGVPAGALSSLAAYWPAYVAYVGSGMLLFAGYLLQAGGVDANAIGFAALIYMVLLFVVARQFEKLVLEALRHRIEVDHLASQLQRAVGTAEAASTAKSQFLANMSHEIRTPMNAVLGLSEMLSDSGLTGTQQQYARTIHSSAGALLALINDVLDVARIEEGHLTLDAKPFALAAMVEGVRDTLLPLADAKQLALDIVIDATLPQVVRGDAARLRQMVMNLAGNAIKFTEHGRVGIEVGSAAPSATHGVPGTPAAHGAKGEQDLQGKPVNLCIAVVDSGPGIEPAQLESLFERFVQGDGSDTRRHGGSGLGLYIVRELAERMGGSVTAQSVPGLGSRFEIVIPLELPSPEQLAGWAAEKPRHDAVSAPLPAQLLAPSSPGTAASPGPAATGLSILLVEDNEVNRMVARGMLTSAGHVVREAGDGVQALAALNAQSFDCILMDVQMPVMGGIEATREIRAREAGGACHTPIIALTANNMQGDRERFLKAGMDDFLAKPFERAALLALLARLTGGTALPLPDTTASALPPAGAQAPVFDAAALDGLIRLDQSSPGLMPSLVARFVPNAHALLARLAGDLPGAPEQQHATRCADMTIAAHTLGSTCARFGALRAAALAASVEQAAAAGKLDEARRLGAQTRIAFEQFEREFEQHPAIVAATA